MVGRAPKAHVRARTRSRLIGLLAPVLGLLLVVGTAPASATPPPPVPRPPVSQPVAPAIPQRYLDQPVDWQPCVFDSTIRRLAPAAPATACATVRVPMDWLMPDAHPDISIAISYSYATGASRGLLTANPGGPGTPARSFTAALAVDRPELFTSFDLLGMDPRGFGDSERLTCTASAADLSRLPTTPDLRRRTAQTHAAERAGTELLGRACSASELSGYVSTQQTAYDLGFVRTLLGYTTLHLVGYGYGARLAGWYAATFPQATGSVLVDSSADWSTNSADSSAATTELRRRQFFGWIARHDGTYHLGRTPAAVDRRYAALRRDLVRSGNDPWELDTAIRQSVSTDLGMLTAADQLRIFARLARTGEGSLSEDDTTALKLLRERLALTEQGQLRAARVLASTAPADVSVDIGPIGAVVRCNDLVHAADPDAEGADVDRRASDFPRWGYLDAVGMCASWPHRAAARSVLLTDVPPVLMVQSAIDPLAGLAGAEAAHERAASSILVVVADTGQHNLVLSGTSVCADRIALAYLLTGSRPVDTVCQGGPLPQETAVRAVGGPKPTGKPAPYRPGTPRVNPVLADAWADAAARA